jgi:hypothetical protein
MCVACDWLQDCQHIAPAAEAPHIPDSRDGLYLQSDAEIIANKERLAKVNYDKGDAVKLQGKALCMKVVGGDAYVGEACSTARRVDVAAGTAARVYRDHAGPVSCVDVAVTGDGALLYTGSWDKTVRVCDAATGAALMTLAGHGDFVKSIRVHGAHIYTGCTDKKLRQWDRATGKLIRTHTGHRHVPPHATRSELPGSWPALSFIFIVHPAGAESKTYAATSATTTSYSRHRPTAPLASGT